MDEPRLYVEPTLVTYGPSDRAKFVADLQAQDRHTVMTPLDSPEQVLLTGDFTTQRGKFRLGTIAFRQLCRVACPGLSNVVTDVAGLRRRKKDSDRGRFSPADAIQVLNTVLKRRFRTDLDGLQVVRDTRTGVIEGIVGRNYRRLPNVELYERSDDVLKTYRLSVDFHGANLVGRYMVLHYLARDPMFSVTVPRFKPDNFRSGFYYSNSEIGDGSVRATLSIVREETGTKALGYFGRSGRLVHTGKDFRRRFERLLNTVAERRPEATDLRDGVVAMMENKLGFVGNEDADEKRFVELAQVLQAKQLTKSLARRIVRNVLLQSSSDRTPVTDMRFVQRAVWPGRTVYDLYNAMTRLSPTLPITLQERVEQLAYALLTGRFKP